LEHKAVLLPRHGYERAKKVNNDKDIFENEPTWCSAVGAMHWFQRACQCDMDEELMKEQL